MPDRIYTAPPGTGTAVTGKTLTELFYDAAERYPNPKALNQPQPGGTWRAYSTDEFRRQAEATALGLLGLGLERGDKVAFLLESDVYFCIADMGCLIAGLVDVPIYVTHTPEQMAYVVRHSEAKALIVSGRERLDEVRQALGGTSEVTTVILCEEHVPGDASGDEAAPDLPEGVALVTLEHVQAQGREQLQEDSAAARREADEAAPGDVATLLYTSGTTGQPKGVVLTHDNVASNALTSIGSFTGFESGAEGERIISFLPLTHIFARMLHYGFVGHGVSVYFTTPDDLAEDLKKVNPTVFATVPRLLEKVYGKIQERTESASGVQKLIGTWALGLARRYDLEREPPAAYKLQAALADVLVFKKWRAALGGQVKYVVSGGAALSAELTNIYAAAGVTILQGYGLTETSPVISFNRPGRNRPGTVGEPIPGVEVRIASDGEILTRGPHVMQGYYQEPEMTAEVLTEDGWLHTGDVGAVDGGFLRITDRKKDLFKLSTGKYVTPSPLEGRLATHNIVEQAVVVGSGHKFCGALLFPNEEALRTWAAAEGLDARQPLEKLVAERAVIDRYQALVDEANEGMDPWTTIKRFALVPAEISIESGLLTPTLKVKRREVHVQHADAVKALYAQAAHEQRSKDQGVIVS